MYPEERALYQQVFEESQDVVKGLANTQLNQQMIQRKQCLMEQ
mgnify:CR=1 FL=1